MIEVQDEQNKTKKRSTAPIKLDKSIDDKAKDDAAISIIRSLDLLITFARSKRLGNAAMMLQSAKESLVYWAANEDFYESPRDRYINAMTTDSCLQPLLDVILQQANIGNPPLQKKLVTMLKFGPDV